MCVCQWRNLLDLPDHLHDDHPSANQQQEEAAVPLLSGYLIKHHCCFKEMNITPSPCLFNTPHDVPPLRSFPEQFLGLSEVTAGGKAIGGGNSIIVQRCRREGMAVEREGGMGTSAPTG